MASLNHIILRSCIRGIQTPRSSKTGGLKANEAMPNSHKKVWWKCSQGHEWQADIGGRNRGNGCPECAKEKRKKAKQGKCTSAKSVGAFFLH